jgi:hypothetical protein
MATQARQLLGRGNTVIVTDRDHTSSRSNSPIFSRKRFGLLRVKWLADRPDAGDRHQHLALLAPVRFSRTCHPNSPA